MREMIRFGFKDSDIGNSYSAVECKWRSRPFCSDEPMILRMRQITQTLLLLLALVFALPAMADYYDGLREWDAGRHGEALVEWQAAASEGDARSMMALGKLFVQGLGAPQDYIEAHKWFNLAASRGLEEALAERDALAEKMTPAQLATAQERATSWQPATSEAETETSEAEPETSEAGAETSEAEPARSEVETETSEAEPATSEAEPATSEAETETSEAEPATSEAETETSKKDPGPPPERAIREAQTLLVALGYEAGAVDGVWNEATAKAYRQFLDDSNQAPSDVLTPKGLRTLRAVAKRRGIDEKRSKKPVAEDVVVRAAKAGDVDGLAKAIAAGADVNARDDKGWSALIYVADKGYVLLLEPLLAAKADPDMRLADGATALFIAVVRRHSEIAAALVKAGADPKIKGTKGKTVFEMARMHQDPALLAALGVPQAGDVFRDCESCPEMVVVPEGSFLMGSPPGEEDRNDDEGPQHRVTIAEPFAVGKYEVTFAEWDACHREGGCSHNPEDEGWGRSSRPVINVSWEDGREFVRWLSEKTGKSYRLLSESEWEYAARGGTQTRYSWGDGIGRNRANCEGCGSRWDNEMTAPVGSFSANEFGLHDMHGNVYEWTADCSNESYHGAPIDGRPWETGNCDERVFRGGSWFNSPRYLRSAFRGWNTSVSRGDIVGFRVARTLD